MKLLAPCLLKDENQLVEAIELLNYNINDASCQNSPLKFS